MRLAATRAIARIGPIAAEAVDPLEAAALDTHPGVRVGALKALARFGPKAKDAWPILLDRALMTAGCEQHWATEALQRCHPLAQPLIKPLIKLALRPDPNIQRRALASLRLLLGSQTASEFPSGCQSAASGATLLWDHPATPLPDGAAMAPASPKSVPRR